MTEQTTALVESILVVGVVLAGLRIMLGRAAVPVLVIIVLCALSKVFPYDPLARLVSQVTCQLALPLLLLWGLYRWVTGTPGKPRQQQNTR